VKTVTQTISQTTGQSLRTAVPLWQLLVMATLMVALYYDVMWRLGMQWATDDNFSHGFFVPLFAAYVVWAGRQRILEIDPRPAWLGLALVIMALGMLVVGLKGAELFLSRSSFVFLLAGLTVYFLGWKMFRALIFPWAFLFLMIPIPNIVFNKIAFPLQKFASVFASGQLDLLGVPVLREGNVMHLPSMSLEVVEACSGIRSLMTLGTLAVIYGYLLEKRIWMRVALAISAVPVAVIANAWRVTGTGLLGQYWDPDKAQGFFHVFSGWIIFLISLLLLFAFHSIFQFIARRFSPPASKAGE
jgi:exosortase